MSRPENQSGAGESYERAEASSLGFPRFHSAATHQRAGAEAQFPPGPIQPAAYVPPEEPATPWPSVRWVRWIAALVIAVMTLTGIGLLVSSLGRDGARAPQGVRAARPVPPGWTQEYAWSRTVSGTASVSVEFNRVAYLDGQRLVVVEASNGHELFASAPVPVSANAKPFISTAQDAPAVGIIDGANLMLWPLDAASGTEPQQVTLAHNAKLHQQAGGLMVSTGKEHWVVTAQAKLLPESVPADHVAMGVTPAGELVSAPQYGEWDFHPVEGGAPRVVRPLRSPDGTIGRMEISWLSRGVIAAWGNTADPAMRTVGLYDADSGSLLAQGRMPNTSVTAGMPLTVSPQQRLASAGPMLSLLGPDPGGQTVVLDRWSTLMSDSKNLYGTRDGVKMVWNGEGQPRELDPKTIIPWGTSIDGLAIVMDPLDSGHLRLGGLRP